MPTSKAKASSSTTQDGEVVKAGSKRKFSLDESELSRIAQEDRAKARKAIEDEKVIHTCMIPNALLSLT